MQKLLPAHRSPPNRREAVKKIIAVIVALAVVFAIGIFIGRETKPQISYAAVAPLVFTANRDNCIFSRGKVTCMQNDETTAGF